jgi:hypothetical protein
MRRQDLAFPACYYLWSKPSGVQIGLSDDLTYSHRKPAREWFLFLVSTCIGVQIGTTAGTSYPVGGVTDTLVHAYHVTGVDAAGNESGASNTVTVALSGKGDGRR